MHIKNIFVVHFVSLKNFLSEYGSKRINLYNLLDGAKHPAG